MTRRRLVKVWRKCLLGRRDSILGSGHSKCKGPEVGNELGLFEEGIEVGVNEGQMVGGEVREEDGARGLYGV